MSSITAKCHKLIDAEILQRSSQVVSVVNGQAYIFGGELRPREPRDNDVHVVSLGSSKSLRLDEQRTFSNGQQITNSGTLDAAITSKPSTSQSPSPRVGSATATLEGKIYLFSGRGGVAMAPVDEQGAIWEYNPSGESWSLISPSETSPESFPAARSYHCMASDGKDTLYVHAGCPEKGRLSDLWGFSVSRRSWTKFAAAPDPARGGTSIAFAAGKLYRMNGFDGNTEQGGSVDVYSPGTNSWATISYSPDGEAGPTPRSVSVVLPVDLQDRPFLVTLFGERDPSSLGHQGAGKMLSDVWAFDIEGKKWEKVNLQSETGEVPLARGWFDADIVDSSTILVHGGLGESNERLGDAWCIGFS